MARRTGLGDDLRPAGDRPETDLPPPDIIDSDQNRGNRQASWPLWRFRPWRFRPWRVRSRRVRLVLRVLLALLLAFLLVTGWSIGNALVAPGGGTFSERIAEWARNHDLGPLVTFGEWLTYQPPRTGGKPSFALTGPSAAQDRDYARPHRTSPAQTGPALTGPLAPRRLRSPAGRPLHGEGTWRVLGTVHGIPAIYGTYLRPDAVHTSYVAGLVWMNQQLLRFELRPGMEDPGPAAWGAPAMIPSGHRRGLLATFNGGFKIANAQGGFYLNGITRGALEPGVASMVYYRSGLMKIGLWDRGGLRMTHSVLGVRQNLKPIVENGRVPASVNSNIETTWGATLGGGYYVWRSGVGITRSGRIVFVYGPALNVQDLASLLRRAGCVTAMQLDINPDWMSFMYYLPGRHPADPTPVNLLPTQTQPADRYYYLANRDFTAVFAR